jgi:hypothetical protein
MWLNCAGGAAGEARVFGNGEADFASAFHEDDDFAADGGDGAGGVSQGAHASAG